MCFPSLSPLPLPSPTQTHGRLKPGIHRPRHAARFARKQVGQQASEDGSIVSHQLARVEVAQRAQQDGILRQPRGRTLGGGRHCQRRLDGAQLPVVVPVFGEHGFGERVERHKLAGQGAGGLEAFCHQHDFADEGQVGHRHGDGAEEGLKVGEGGWGGGKLSLCFPPSLSFLPPHHTHTHTQFLLTVRLSGNSARPEYPGFMVMNAMAVGTRGTVTPSHT